MGITTQAAADVTQQQRQLHHRVRTRARFKEDGYSPLFRAIQSALQLLIVFRRAIHSTRRRWTSLAADSLPQHKFLQATLRWRAAHPTTRLPEEQHAALRRVDDILTALSLHPHEADIESSIATAWPTLH